MPLCSLSAVSAIHLIKRSNLMSQHVLNAMRISETLACTYQILMATVWIAISGIFGELKTALYVRIVIRTERSITLASAVTNVITSGHEVFILSGML